MKFINHYVILLLLLVATSVFAQPKDADKISILFIGNSYTYYNSSPELVKAMIRERFPERQVATKLISGGGMTLEDHWRNERTLETIRTGGWDYVVLQEQSKLGMGVMIDDEIYFGATDRFFEHARKLHAEISKTDAETVFMMTWSVAERPKEQAILSHAYTAIARELGAVVAPVGLVWDKVRNHPDMDLYADDGGHPSPMGSYLAAVTIYATLTGEDPDGLSGTISGRRLSPAGFPSEVSQVLVDLSQEQVQLLQDASWEVVNAMKASGDHRDFMRPEPFYTIPVLAKGEPIKLQNLIGKWYGTGTYGSNYLGHIMEVKAVEGKPVVSLSFYSPHAQDQVKVDSVKIEGDQLKLKVYDPLRRVDAEVRMTFNKGRMEGILESFGNIKLYKHLHFSGEPVQHKTDLSAMALLMEEYRTNTVKEGYVSASLKHYEKYSELIGESYKPEEFFLNAVGYNFLRDGRADDALNAFELAMVYYPESVNTYDSYAEGLIAAGRKEEALEVYTKAYELAKRTNYENLAYIEANLNRLKNNKDLDQNAGAAPTPPPPPPPPPQQ